VKTGDDYLALQCEMSRNGASLDEVEHLICIAHYLFREAKFPHSVALAYDGEHYYRQVKRPN